MPVGVMDKPVQKQTYYDVLGLTRDVSLPEIKKAYRQLVKSHHPDVDYHDLNGRQRKLANDEMRRLNEAYEILKDRRKRAAYDSLIDSAKRKSKSMSPTEMIDPSDTEAARQHYLRQILHPARRAIMKAINRYEQELKALSQDIYDLDLVTTFEKYGDDVEGALIRASQALSSKPVPNSLKACELMMRYAIAQAADGLEEIRYFCRNYDYDHLNMAGNLFRESTHLLKKALKLTKQ